MKIQLTRTTVLTPLGETDARIVEAGAMVDLEKADAALLVAIKRARWLKGADAQAADARPHAETADARPTARKPGA